MSNNQKPPIFQQINSGSVTSEVADKIIGAIKKGLFEPGDQLPSEPKLADQLGVSRNTVREAVNGLVEKGLLLKKRGIGTFISFQSPRLIRSNLARAFGTSELIQSQDMLPGQEGFGWTTEVPSDHVLHNLELPSGTEVLHISRTRTADNRPFSYSDEYIPLGLEGIQYDFSFIDADKNWSMYEFFEKRGYEVNSVVTHVHAIKADKEISHKLKIQPGTPILQLEQTHYSNNLLKPFLFGINYHNDKIIDMMIVRAGLGSN